MRAPRTADPAGPHRTRRAMLEPMRLEDPITTIMTAGPETVGPSARLSAVREILFRTRVHHVPVVSDRRLLGIVSSNDLLRAGPGSHDANASDVEAALDTKLAAEVMTRDPFTLSQNDTIRRAMQVLETGSFRSLPVVEDTGELLGIVTVGDLFAYVLASNS